jgi:lactoylglutathione lyase
MITHIKSVTVYVENQERAIAFWTEKLWFEVRERKPMGPKGDWIEVALKGERTGLVLYPRSMTKDWQQKKPSIVFRTDDCNATYKELSRKGVPFKETPTKMDWGVYAVFTDPDGNEFVIASVVG